MKTYAPTYTTTIQVIQMLRLLDSRYLAAMPVSELAERLEVHPRTVKRYVDALAGSITNEDGSPVVRRESRQGQPWAVMPRQSAQPGEFAA